MKKSNFKFLLIAAILLSAVVGVSVYSCEKEVILPSQESASKTNQDGFVTEPGAVCGEIQEKNIFNRENEVIGQALVYNDTKYFYVVMSCFRGYNFNETYMQIDDKFGNFPLTDAGNPDITNFEYSILDRPASNTRKFRIPLTEIAGVSNLTVAAMIQSTENREDKPTVAWVDGKFYGAEKTGRTFVFSKTTCMTTEAETVQE